jgi:hypothetical protein
MIFGIKGLVVFATVRPLMSAAIASLVNLKSNMARSARFAFRMLRASSGVEANSTNR